MAGAQVDVNSGKELTLANDDEPSGELVVHFASIEQARNAAIKWLEIRGVVFGPHRKVEIGRLGLLKGYEVGVSGTGELFWRIRLDYDPVKKAHYNAEVGEGRRRQKQAFTFPGGEELIERLSNSREPRG